MGALRTRDEFEKEEAERLAPYATRSRESRGRVVDEVEPVYRTAFQRDRDRVVHSRAFRRLESKTQVFVGQEGDHYRNRLTHTLEGAQVARSIARALRLNEDLAEAIALAHDLGHTPFGHAGERELARRMRESGGFDHNRQSLRVVDWLEERDARFRGLNLTAETREGILKHGADFAHPVPLPTLGSQRSLEAQVANVADEIAYVSHDLEDGVRAGILTEERLDPLRLWRDATSEIAESVSGAAPGIRLSQAIIAVLGRLVEDVTETTARGLDDAPPRSHEDVLSSTRTWVTFSPAVEEARRELKQFLVEHFYHHPTVQGTTRAAEAVVGDLFRAYRDRPDLLPERARARLPAEGLERVVADYVAGMTDPFAMAEHRRLLDADAPS